MNRNPDVDAWFDRLNHPLREAMMRARDVILAADDRVTECIKWSTPTFQYKGNIASFQPRAKRFVSLMFHRGSEIPGSHPSLEGDAALARVMRFSDAGDVDARKNELAAVIRAWCDSR